MVPTASRPRAPWGISERNGMKTWHKIGIGLAAAAVLGGIVWFSISQANKGVVTVQTSKVAKQEALVSLVTASGEIKPTTYTNITAQGFGRITEILVREGDHIRKGDKLLLQDNVQAKTTSKNYTVRTVYIMLQLYFTTSGYWPMFCLREN